MLPCLDGAGRNFSSLVVTSLPAGGAIRASIFFLSPYRPLYYSVYLRKMNTLFLPYHQLTLSSTPLPTFFPTVHLHLLHSPPQTASQPHLPPASDLIHTVCKTRIISLDKHVKIRCRPKFAVSLSHPTPSANHHAPLAPRTRIIATYANLSRSNRGPISQLSGHGLAGPGMAWKRIARVLRRTENGVCLSE